MTEHLRVEYRKIETLIPFARNAWDRIATHPGKICENIIQAIARDLLVEGLFQVNRDPALEIVGHVHDEILALADDPEHPAQLRPVRT